MYMLTFLCYITNILFSYLNYICVFDYLFISS